MRRKDKLTNMKLVNTLFESRNSIPLTRVGSKEGEVTSQARPKLTNVGGKEGDANPQKRLPIKPKVEEAPSFGGQKVSQDQYDDLQSDKQNLEKASGEAFATPEGYTTNAQVGRSYDTSDGDTVKVLNIDEKGNILVYLQFGHDSAQMYSKYGMPAPKPFKITWSPKQFDAIVGKIEDDDDNPYYHDEVHGY